MSPPLNLGLKGQTIGIGPTFVFPTAGDNEFTGNGKWQAGPTFLYINHATKTQFGILAYMDNIFIERLWRSLKYEAV